MKILERDPTKEEQTLVDENGLQNLSTNNGYVTSIGDNLNSIFDDLAEVLGNFNLQLTDINFDSSHFVLKIEPVVKNESPLGDLEFHKRLISGVTKLGVTGDILRHHVQDVWDDAIKSTLVIDNEKKNTATIEELDAFTDHIVDGTDIPTLFEMYEEEISDLLWSLTDEELEEKKVFYGYKG